MSIIKMIRQDYYKKEMDKLKMLEDLINKIKYSNLELKVIIQNIKFYQTFSKNCIEISKNNLCSLEKFEKFFYNQEEFDFLINNFYYQNDKNKGIFTIINCKVYIINNFIPDEKYIFKYLDFKSYNQFMLLKNNSNINLELIENFFKYVIDYKKNKGCYFDFNFSILDQEYFLFEKKIQKIGIDSTKDLFLEYIYYRIGIFLNQCLKKEVLNLNSYWENFNYSSITITDELLSKILL